MSDIEPEDELGIERKRWPLWKILVVAGVAGCLPCVILTGLLAALIVPSVIRNVMVADQGKAKADIVAIASAIDQYAIENKGRYPDRLEVLIMTDENGFTYLSGAVSMMDPWHHEYVYEPPPPGTNDYRVISYGADGVPGGSGLDQDFDNVMIRNGEF